MRGQRSDRRARDPDRTGSGPGDPPRHRPAPGARRASSSAERMVVGLPLSLSGADSDQTARDARVRRSGSATRCRSPSSCTTSGLTTRLARADRRRRERGLARRRASARELAGGSAPERRVADGRAQRGGARGGAARARAPARRARGAAPPPAAAGAVATSRRWRRAPVGRRTDGGDEPTTGRPRGDARSGTPSDTSRRAARAACAARAVARAAHPRRPPLGRPRGSRAGRALALIAADARDRARLVPDRAVPAVHGSGHGTSR